VPFAGGRVRAGGAVDVAVDNSGAVL